MMTKLYVNDEITLFDGTFKNDFYLDTYMLVKLFVVFGSFVGHTFTTFR